MRRPLAATILVLSVAVPLAAYAEPVTYDFTGTVTSGSGIYQSIAPGTSVTGSFTIDLANANPTQSSSPDMIGSQTSDWQLNNFGGGLYGTAAPAGTILASTVQVGSISYTSLLPQSGDYNDDSYIMTNGVGEGGEVFWSAQENVFPNSIFDGGRASFISLAGTSGPWTGAGLPDFSAADIFATGQFSFAQSDSVSYSITSITPVPLPAAAWLMVTGLAGLGAAIRRSRSSSTELARLP